MRSGLFRLPKGRWWLRRHVRLAATPGRYTAVVTPRSTVSQVIVSVRRHPDAARATVERIQ